MRSQLQLVSRSRTWLAVVVACVACNSLFDIQDPQHLGVTDSGAQKCLLASDCATDEVCLFRVCSPPCAKDKDCGPGQRCLHTASGVACVDEVQAACGGDTGAGCPDGTACVDGACFADCSIEGVVCPGGQTCQDGACRAEPGSVLPPSGGESAGGAASGGMGAGGAAGGAGGATAGGAGGTPPGDNGGEPAGGAGGQGPQPACKAGATRSCADDGLKGTCATGTEKCTAAGEWGACNVLPQTADTCIPGNDDDCDGKVNEGCICVPTYTRPCTDDNLQGTCAAGTETCAADGTWGACSIPPQAADTCVQGNDDSCDGTPNKDCVCIVGTTRKCSDGGLYGKCKDGTETCDATGNWGACSITPSAKDACTDMNDDNCNGSVMEGCTCTNGKTRSCSLDGLKGPCAAGTETCTGGSWGACSILPASADTCAANNDANCNGTANEGCLCIEGVTSQDCGQCGDGKKYCTDGKQNTYGGCTGGTSVTTYYRDADGDGYGNPTNTSTVCGGAPSGYVSDANDCCDSDGRAHPGGGAQYSARVGGCPGGWGTSFDFNCDGGDTLVDTSIYCSTGSEGYGTCSYGWFIVPGCGGAGQHCYDCWNGDSYSTCCDPTDYQACY